MSSHQPIDELSQTPEPPVRRRGRTLIVAVVVAVALLASLLALGLPSGAGDTATAVDEAPTATEPVGDAEPSTATIARPSTTTVAADGEASVSFDTTGESAERPQRRQVPTTAPAASADVSPGVAPGVADQPAEPVVPVAPYPAPQFAITCQGCTTNGNTFTFPTGVLDAGFTMQNIGDVPIDVALPNPWSNGIDPVVDTSWTLAPGATAHLHLILCDEWPLVATEDWALERELLIDTGTWQGTIGYDIEFTMAAWQQIPGCAN